MLYYKVTTSESGSAGALRMHSTPDTDESSVISSVPHGGVVQGYSVTPDQNGMRYVSYNGISGWVSTLYLTACDEKGNTTTTTTTTVDRQTNVLPPTTDSSSESTSNKGKTWLIIGGVAMAAGALMNAFM